MEVWEHHEVTPAAGNWMHAARSGPDDAPVVVGIPGLGCSYRSFGPLARALAPDFQTIGLDLPGFGRTPGPRTGLDVRGMAEALADWLRATDRGGAILVGDSTGGQVIVELGVIEPELLGPALLSGPVFDADARTIRQQVRRMLRNFWADRNAGMSLTTIRLRERFESGLWRWFRTFLRCLHYPLEQRIGQLSVPVTVVRGEWDPLVPAGWAAELTARLPQGRLVTAPRAGHSANFIRPEVLAREVTSLAHGRAITR